MKFTIAIATLIAATTTTNVVEAKDKLKATFDDTFIQATVAVKQSSKDAEKNNAQWTVKFDTFKENELCQSGSLNWHIHQYRVLGDDTGLGDAECGAAITGGHYDPTFACGGSSQNNANGSCDELRNTPRNIPAVQEDVPEGPVIGSTSEYTANCGNENQSACEIGDQSGKMGKLTTSRSKQKFKDYWMEPLSKIEGKSIVLHCCDENGGCSARIACANLLVE